MKQLFRGLLALVFMVSMGVVVASHLPARSAEPAAVTAETATPALIVAAVEQPAPTSEQAVQQVVQRSNEEQAQAIAAGNPSLMSDTVTNEHFQELTQINQSLIDHGVSSIALLNLEWGQVSVNGSRATTTTFETWRTTYADGTIEQSRDRNDYTLVLDSGTWKIQANEHPDTGQAARGTSPLPQRPIPSDPGIPNDQSASHNWSGYAATGGTYTAVSGSWTVPPFKADGEFGLDAAWVGIGGVRSRDLIQAGTSQTVSGTGSTQYQAWVEMLPRASRTVPLSVHPGDSVSVSISEQSANDWLIQFTNNTTGATYQETQHYVSSHSSAEWVEEAPSSAGRGGVLPLSNFGSVEFANATTVKNGQTLSIADAAGRAITMIGSRNQALAVPTDLGSDGASFSVARTDAPVTTSAAPNRRRGR
jgi:hypothetical protein